MTRKWIELNDFSNVQYSVNKNIRFKTPMLRSHVSDYGDAYIVVKRRITVAGTNNANRKNKKLTLIVLQFRSCISKINNTFVDNAENLDIVMSIYNLLVQ